MKYTEEEWNALSKEEKLLFFLEKDIEILQGDVSKLRKAPKDLPQISKALSMVKNLNNDLLNMLKNALNLG